jgi:hypothetical protein
MATMARIMTELPKQDLLAKLLKMTSSSNDGEALVAIRKANALLISAGWDWDKLLAGKIRVAADPFAGLQTPHNPTEDGFAPRPPPRPAAPRPPPPPRSTYQAPPAPPPPRPKPHEPWSERSTNGQTNAFPGNCYCCGHSVSARDGKLFVPSQFNRRALSGKKVICTACDTNRYTNIDNRPAPQPAPYAGPAPSAGDL